MSIADALIVVMPHLGILDSWLPILDNLKRREAPITIDAAAPHWKRLARAQSDDFLLHQCDALVDSVLTRMFGEAWRQFDSFDQAASHARTQMHLPGSRLNEWLYRRFPRATATIDRRTPTGKIIFSDVDLLDQPTLQGLRFRSRRSRWFSLPHGIDPRVAALLPRTTSANSVKIKVYASSEQEAAHYQSAYGIPDSRIETVGVPRHSQQWIRRLRELYGALGAERGKFIFLASRPVNKSNFPPAKKTELLRDLRAVADRLECHVVVRLHPAETEADRTIIETALGRDRQNSRWSYSVLPAMVAADGAVFAVTMFSSVAVDMLAIDVPPVELFDFSGLAHIPSVVPNSNEGMTSIYRHLGLVMGASNKTELEARARTIAADRFGVLDGLKAAYRRTYADPHRAIDIIAKDVMAVLNPT